MPHRCGSFPSSGSGGLGFVPGGPRDGPSSRLTGSPGSPMRFSLGNKTGAGASPPERPAAEATMETTDAHLPNP